MMEQTFKATEIKVGFHPDGYRIDKTASPMSLYTKWQVSDDGRWHSPEPVDFDALPEDGWFKTKGFNWNQKLYGRSNNGHV
jgi:hypothetical protein